MPAQQEAHTEPSSDPHEKITNVIAAVAIAAFFAFLVVDEFLATNVQGMPGRVVSYRTAEYEAPDGKAHRDIWGVEFRFAGVTISRVDLSKIGLSADEIQKIRVRRHYYCDVRFSGLLHIATSLKNCKRPDIVRD